MHSFGWHRRFLCLSLALCLTTGCQRMNNLASSSRPDSGSQQTVDLNQTDAAPRHAAGDVVPVTHETSETSTLGRLWEKTTALPKIALPQTSDDSKPLDGHEQFQEL